MSLEAWPCDKKGKMIGDENFVDSPEELVGTSMSQSHLHFLTLCTF